MRSLAAALAALLGLGYAAGLVASGLVARDLLAGMGAVLAVAFAAFGAGSRILAALAGREPEGGEDAAAAFLLGLGALSLVGWALALAGLFVAPLLAVLVAALVPLAVRSARRLSGTGKAGVPSSGRLERALAATIAVSAGAALLAGLPPATWFDALEYHLALPQLYLVEGRAPDLPHNLFANLPHLYEIGFAWVLALEPRAPLAPLHWLGGAALVAAASGLAGRLHPRAGLVAAALVAASPPVARNAAIPGIDLFLAGLAAHALSRLLAASERPAERRVAVVLTGLALATKLHGAMVPAALAVAWLALGPGRPRLRDRALAVPVLVALLVPASFHLRSWWLRGRPGWPFLAGADDEASWVASVIDYTRWSGIDQGSLADLPAALAAQLAARDGVGPVPVMGLLLLALLPAGPARRVRLAIGGFAAAVLVVWTAGARVDRYAFPAAGAVAALAAAGIATAREVLPRRLARRVALGAATALAAASAAIAIDLEAGRDFFAYIAGHETRLAYLERAVESSPHAVIERANQELPPAARVLSFDDPRLFGLWRPWRAATAFDRPLLPQWAGAGPRADPERLWREVSARGFTHLLASPAYARELERRFPRLLRRDPGEQAALDALVARHGRLLFARRGVALYALDR